MRSTLALIGLALGMAFLAGASLWWVRSDQRTVSDQDILAINNLKFGFQREVTPQAIINISSYYFNNHLMKLIGPVYVMPSFDHGDSRFYSKGESCFDGLKSLEGLYGYDKVMMWEEFRCGARAKLPENFFEIPPYMHPGGVSFIYLAYQTGRPFFRQLDWLIDHISFFHFSEIKKVPEFQNHLNGIYFYLGALTEQESYELAVGKGTVLTDKFLFARLRYKDDPTTIEYRVYDRLDLENFLKETDYVISRFKYKITCFYRDEELCWQPNARKLIERLNLSQAGLFVGGLFTMILALIGLIGRIKDDRIDEENKRLALQTLTHELRTPITSLMLESENLGKYFDQVSPEMQDSLMRVNSEIHRLKRLVETSRQYLKFHGKKGEIPLTPVVIPSLNDFFQELLEGYTERGVNYRPSTHDGPFITDNFWLGTIVKNLVENACNHGLPPVEVWSERLAGKLVILVSDRGDGKELTCQSIGDEFVKGSKSSGTGLGLSIVRRAARAMGGDLRFCLNPTTFSVVIKELKLPQKENTGNLK